MSKEKKFAAVVANNFIQQMRFSGQRLVTVNGDVFFYNGTNYDLYELLAKDVTEYVIKQHSVQDCYASFVAEVVGTIKNRTQIAHGWRPYYIGHQHKPAPILLLQNGILTFDADGGHRFRSHTDELFATASADYKFDPSVGECRVFRDFLWHFVGHDQDAYDLQLQLMAAPLLRNFVDFQQYPIFVGESGANGKSVRLNAQKYLYGPGNVSGVSLDMFGEKFALSGMLHKIWNVDVDINDSSKVAESKLKKMIDGSVMIFEEKFKALVSMPCLCSIAFSCNLLPKFRAHDGGTRRRIILIPCEAQVEDDQKVQKLEEHFNYSGVLNMVLDMMPRLIEQKGFTIPASIREFDNQFWLENNSVHHFLAEHTEVSPGRLLPKSFLYDHYKTWAQDQGYKTFSSVNFGKQFAAFYRVEIASGVVNADSKTKSIPGQPRSRAYLGIDFYAYGVTNKPVSKIPDVDVQEKQPVESQEEIPF